MSATTVSDPLAERIAELLDRALNSIARDDAGNRVYSIEQAAERLNMGPRTLEQWCRDGLVTHTKLGRFRGLTGEQIAALAARHVQHGIDKPIVVDDLEQAREQTRRGSASRRGRSR